MRVNVSGGRGERRGHRTKRRTEGHRNAPHRCISCAYGLHRCPSRPRAHTPWPPHCRSASPRGTNLHRGRRTRMCACHSTKHSKIAAHVPCPSSPFPPLSHFSLCGACALSYPAREPPSTTPLRLTPVKTHALLACSSCVASGHQGTRSTEGWRDAGWYRTVLRLGTRAEKNGAAHQARVGSARLQKRNNWRRR